MLLKLVNYKNKIIMGKSIKFFGVISAILVLLVGIAGTSDYWEKAFPFKEGGIISNFVWFFSTVGVGLLAISFIILVVLIILDKKRSSSRVN